MYSCVFSTICSPFDLRLMLSVSSQSQLSLLLFYHNSQHAEIEFIFTFVCAVHRRHFFAVPHRLHVRAQVRRLVKGPHMNRERRAILPLPIGSLLGTQKTQHTSLALSFGFPRSSSTEEPQIQQQDLAKSRNNTTGFRRNAITYVEDDDVYAAAIAPSQLHRALSEAQSSLHLSAQ